MSSELEELKGPLRWPAGLSSASIVDAVADDGHRR
jgi:hypothetical protein